MVAVLLVAVLLVAVLLVEVVGVGLLSLFPHRIKRPARVCGWVGVWLGGTLLLLVHCW